MTSAPVHDAIVIGAGFGGMGATIALKRLGLDDVVVLDREDDLGGTWHVNHYPGLAVDIPSSTYQYSFAPNPYWTRLFAPGAELKRYAEHVADTHDLRRHMRFGESVEGARWDPEAGHWDVTVAGGEVLKGRFLVPATGFLSQPKLPEIAGIEDFAGTVIHTADWDDRQDLHGQRVAVIGTGATAVQLIPTIADRVSELTVYQRTAIWVSAKPDVPIPGVVRGLFAHVPLTQRAVRAVGSGLLEVLMIAGVLEYERIPMANRLGEAVCRAQLLRQIRDPQLRRRLTPDYSFGCKRPTFSNDYYPAFTKDHVHLETESIDHIDASGIVTADGRRTEVDVLICATGFDLWEANFPPFPIEGRDELDLGEFWRGTRFQAYEGIAVPGFPNLLSLNSPFAYSGLSFFTTIESQMRHMQRLLGHMKRIDATAFEVTEDANDAFLDRMSDRLGGTVFELGECATSNSYYFNPHGEATLLRPTSTRNAMREAASFPLNDYAYGFA